MSTQGWMIPTVSLSCSGSTGPPDVSDVSGISLHGTENVDCCREKGERRLELLKRIKNRIKTGFYNSDAVIDDIGHGFAQALDQAL